MGVQLLGCNLYKTGVQLFWVVSFWGATFEIWSATFSGCNISGMQPLKDQSATFVRGNFLGMQLMKDWSATFVKYNIYGSATLEGLEHNFCDLHHLRMQLLRDWSATFVRQCFGV